MISRRALGATMIALAMTLTACGSDGDSAKSSASEQAENLPAYSNQDVAVDTSQQVPVFTFPETKAPKELTVQVVKEGEGTVVGENDFVVVDYVGQVWRKDKPFDSSYSRGTSFATSLNQVVVGWKEGMAGHKVGSKLIISIPADKGYGSQGNDSAGIGSDDVMTFYVEIHDAFSADRAGQADAVPEADVSALPITYDGALGSPVTSMTVKDPAASVTEQSVSVIARGTGPAIEASGTMYVAYYAVTSDGKQSSTTWGESGIGVQSVQIGSGQFFDSLVGTQVGSRVFMTIPGSQASGGQNSPAFYLVADILSYAK